jgi:hypothetical protein
MFVFYFLHKKGWWAVMYEYAMSIDFAYFYDFPIGFWRCSYFYPVSYQKHRNQPIETEILAFKEEVLWHRTCIIFYVCVTFTEYLMCKMFRLMCCVNWFHIVIWNQIILLPSIKNVCIHAFIMDLWENNFYAWYDTVLFSILFE